MALGRADAQIMLIGEQPGLYEDREGPPFVHPSGQLLKPFEPIEILQCAPEILCGNSRALTAFASRTRLQNTRADASAA
jgi:hypothetical protein